MPYMRESIFEHDPSEPAVLIRSIRSTFRGTSDARSSVDRDTRIRIAISSMQAATLWHVLGERLTDKENQQSDPGADH